MTIMDEENEEKIIINNKKAERAATKPSVESG